MCGCIAATRGLRQAMVLSALSVSAAAGWSEAVRNAGAVRGEGTGDRGGAAGGTRACHTGDDCAPVLLSFQRHTLGQVHWASSSVLGKVKMRRSA